MYLKTYNERTEKIVIEMNEQELHELTLLLEQSNVVIPCVKENVPTRHQSYNERKE